MIAALLLLAPITPVPDEPKPIPTTISAIRKDPKKFDGQVVRLHGWVNQCAPRGCLIEDRSAASPGGAGASLSIVGNAKFDATIKPLLPTYVEFDARFDASCRIQASGSAITICADRAPELTVLTLRGVVSPEPPPFEKP